MMRTPRPTTSNKDRQVESEQELWNDAFNWEHLIKNHCVVCDRKIEGSRTYYFQYGNYCGSCNAKCNNKAADYISNALRALRRLDT